MHTFTPTRRIALALAALSACGTLYAQQSPPVSIGPANPPAATSMSDNPGTGAAPGSNDDSSQQAPLSVEDLDTLLAPVALYPDSLLSQVLMASTYPLEVVQANRWLQANATLTGDALADALNQQPWDPSVKSLVNTPSVLQMMDDKLDWTIRLGDAFLAQQADVMNSVQRLRAQAQQAGTLRSTAQQNITYENAYDDGATNPPVPQYIEIQETSPQYVYVPVYDPFVVYGNWRYRTHPWFWHPHNYVPTSGIWFGDRYTCGPAWGYAWGEPDWARHDLDLDPHRHSTLNPRFDSDRYVEQHYRHNRDNDGRDNDGRDNDGRNNAPRGGGDRGTGDRGAPNRDHRDDNDNNSGRVTWRHDPTHRRGVAYPDAATAQRFGRPAQLPNAASPRLPNTVSPNLPNTVSPRLPNTVSPNLPNAASPRLPNASATPDADHRGIAPVRPQDPRRDLPTQNNPRDRNNGDADNDANRPDRSNDDRLHDDRSTPDRPNGDHSNADRQNTDHSKGPTRGNAPDAGQPRDDRNVHPIRPSDRTTGAGNASDTPPAPVPPKPQPAPEPTPTPPTLPKPTPTQPPAPQDTPRRVVPQPTPPQAPQPQVPQAPAPHVPQPAAPRREAPHDAPRHEAPAAPTPAAPTPDVPAAPARGGPHGSAGAPDTPAPAPAAPSNAPAAGPHGGR